MTQQDVVLGAAQEFLDMAIDHAAASIRFAFAANLEGMRVERDISRGLFVMAAAVANSVGGGE